MRLTLSTLPQLAVLAKILCLLMVVMCGAVPSTVRSVSLYSTCSRGNVTVHGRTVKSTARNEHNAPYQKMTTQTEDFSMKLYIFAEKSKRYICFSKRWKVISLPKKRRDEYCQFHETYNGRYLNYQSAVDKTRFIGFNKSGKPMTSPRGRQECYNFLKLNPHANVAQHNQIVSSNKGGMKHQGSPATRPASGERAAPRKPLHAGGLRAAKSSLAPSASSASPTSSVRLAQQPPQSRPQRQPVQQLVAAGTRLHRHRHYGSWRMMRQNATRRRHASHRSGGGGLLGDATPAKGQY